MFLLGLRDTFRLEFDKAALAFEINTTELPLIVVFGMG